MTVNGLLAPGFECFLHSRIDPRDLRQDWILALGEPPVHVTSDFSQ